MAPIDESAELVVTGDVTLDWNLARISTDSVTSVWNPEDRARMCRQRGGAAMLADVIEAVTSVRPQELARDFCVRTFRLPTRRIRPGHPRYHQSYAMWAPYPNPGGDLPPWVWRVSAYLGLDRARELPEAAEGDHRRIENEPDDPGLIVLDDAGLGFRDDPRLWPAALRDRECSAWVVAKMAEPVARGALWKRLVETCAEHVIAVTTVGDLRRTQVHISQELSWERTAQDLFWELIHNPRINSMSLCAHVVVSLHTAGALLLSRRPCGDDEAAPPAWDCRLIFDPTIAEGGWRRRYEGGMIGYTTCLVAGIARQLMLPEPKLEAGVQSGLSAMRVLHRNGYGAQDPAGPLSEPAFPVELVADAAAAGRAELAAVTVQDPVRFLGGADGAGDGRGGGFWTILDDVCASPPSACDELDTPLSGTAERIVREGAKGAKSALRGVPICEFGHLTTADRREIEGFRSISRLMEQYCRARQSKPLAIAVFGPPGSGKSFGVTQVAQSVEGASVQVCEFNLSQLGGPEDLVDALHQVRDIGLAGDIPLVFWDEFDTELDGELGWLRYFLAPIQDGAFQDGQIVHHIGRAIFVFAGGTSASMEQFDRGHQCDAFRNAKGPDFVSRLKGFVDIMGPNCQEDQPGGDPHFLIRRAILLRSLLTRNAPQIMAECDGGEGPQMDPGVLRAFLHIGDYKHGARSMEAIIRMSALAGRDRFERSCLPTAEQLDLHVNGREFHAIVQLPAFDDDVLLDRLAAATHEVYRGSVGSYEGRSEYADQPYENLLPNLQQQNRDFVRHVLTKVGAIGYAVIPARSDDPPVGFPGDHLEYLAEMEHDRWMRLKLEQGYRWGPERDEDALINPYMLPWNEITDAERARRLGADADRIGPGHLSDDQKKWDRDLVKSIPAVMAEAGYTLIALAGREE